MLGVHGWGCVWLGGVCVAGGVHGWGGHTWPGGMLEGACVAKGGVHGKGGMHGKGGCAWQRGGMCGEGGMCGIHAPLYEIWPVNAQAVCILLECILVSLGEHIENPCAKILHE